MAETKLFAYYTQTFKKTLLFQDLQATEKPKSVEYHVNTPILSTPTTTKEPKFDTQRNSMDNKIESSENDTQSSEIHNGSKSPEEEIDNAFEIIDKS